MALLVHMSPKRFGQLHRKFFGISPAEDLIQARLERAKYLLSSTTLSVGRAAERSGFTNPYYFSRLFHRRVGCAPRDYQKIASPRVTPPA
jgi:AraC-like DNA-binding protein